MRARREVARQKREEMFDLDNEEGFEGAEDEEDILDDEGEMSDKTDTDVEDEEEELDEEEGYGEQEEKVVGSSKKNDNNHGLSQGLETGCPKLAIVKLLEILYLKVNCNTFKLQP